MVLRGKPRGRVGRCRILFARLIRVRRAFFRQRRQAGRSVEENLLQRHHQAQPGANRRRAKKRVGGVKLQRG